VPQEAAEGGATSSEGRRQLEQIRTPTGHPPTRTFWTSSDRVRHIFTLLLVHFQCI